MRKVLCTGDLHIAEAFDLTQIDRLLDKVAIEANSRDELFLLGDMFHKSRISPLEIMSFIRFLKKIKVPITMIAGNHDMAAENSILDWVPTVFPNITFSKTTLTVQREGVSILLAHYNVAESIMGAYDTKINTTISANDLDVDLALLGHIHKSQHIQGQRAQVVHPGSLFYIDFNERNDVKGLVEVTIDADKYKIEHIELDPDPIVQLSITPDTEADVLKAYPKNCRVKLDIHYSDPSLNKREVHKKFAKYLFKDLKIIFTYDNPNMLGTIINDGHKEEKNIERLEKYLESNTTEEIRALILEVLANVK